MEEDMTHVLAAYKKRRAELVANSRLSLPAPVRISLATASSFVLGMGLGLSHGSRAAGLRFRAENAHRLPKTSTGWYLYHKSKNYHMAFQGVREGLKMGFKISLWAAAFFWIEDCWDDIRGEKDFLNTTVASLSVAGGFSLWNRFPVIAAARTAKMGLALGLGYGLAQDAVGAMRGRMPGYVQFLQRGGKRKAGSVQMEVT